MPGQNMQGARFNGYHQDENIIMTPHTAERRLDGGTPGILNASARAKAAAELEQKSNYGEAVRWWRMAAEAARNPRQQHRQESRASLCEHCHQTPLSQPER